MVYWNAGPWEQWMHCSVMLRREEWCSAVQCNAVQCSAVQCSVGWNFMFRLPGGGGEWRSDDGKSPSHPVTQSPSHPVIQSPSHPVIQSSSYMIIKPSTTKVIFESNCSFCCDSQNYHKKKLVKVLIKVTSYIKSYQTKRISNLRMLIW